MKDVSTIVDMRNNGMSIFFNSTRIPGKKFFKEKVENGDDVDLRIGDHDIFVMKVEAVEGGKWHGKIGRLLGCEDGCKGLLDGEDVLFGEDYIFSCTKA